MRRVLLSFVLTTACLVPACATDGAVDEELEMTEGALTGALTVGAKLTTTANLYMRAAPQKDPSDDTIIPKGQTVTVVESGQKNGYYHVAWNGEDGWSHGNYLKAGAGAKAPAGADDDDDDDKNAGTGAGGAPVTGGEQCKASFYASGQKTANGEKFDPNGLTAAHKTLPFNTKVRVTNVANGKTVTVRINDRGPFIAGRCLDLARGAFDDIAAVSAGVVTVRWEVVK